MAASQGSVTGSLGAPRVLNPAAARPASSVLRSVAIATAAVAVGIVMAMPWSPIGQIFGTPTSDTETDFGMHAKVAQDMATNGITSPHFLWHLLVVSLHAVRPSSSWMD